MMELSVEGLDEAQSAAKARSMTEEEFVNDGVQERINQYNEITGESVTTLEEIERAHEANGLPSSPLEETIDHLREIHANYQAGGQYDSSFARADSITRKLIDSGIDGIYISDKFEERPPRFNEQDDPNSNQLALFRPELMEFVGIKAKVEQALQEANAQLASPAPKTEEELEEVLNTMDRTVPWGEQADPIAQDIVKSKDFLELKALLNKKGIAITGRPLGAGASSVVLNTNKGALRLGLGSLVEIPKSNWVIQPIESGTVGNLRYELMPLAETKGLNSTDLATVKDGLKKDGLTFSDPGIDNIGRVNGQLMVIDPGAISTVVVNEPEVSPKQLKVKAAEAAWREAKAKNPEDAAVAIETAIAQTKRISNIQDRYIAKHTIALAELNKISTPAYKAFDAEMQRIDDLANDLGNSTKREAKSILNQLDKLIDINKKELLDILKDKDMDVEDITSDVNMAVEDYRRNEMSKFDPTLSVQQALDAASETFDQSMMQELKDNDMPTETKSIECG